MGPPRAIGDLPLFCEEVAGMLVPDQRLITEHLQEAEGTVEMMLARLAEMNTMLETMDASSAAERAQIEPLLKDFCKRLDAEYAYIDRTAESALHMRRAVQHMELELANAADAQSKINRDAALTSLGSKLRTVANPSSWGIGWGKSGAGADAAAGTSEGGGVHKPEKAPGRYKNENLAMTEAFVSAMWQGAKSAAHSASTMSKTEAPVAAEVATGVEGQVVGQVAGQVAGQVCNGEDDEEDEEEEKQQAPEKPLASSYSTVRLQQLAIKRAAQQADADFQAKAKAKQADADFHAGK
mmetsp:Transcript_42058/g.70175  ORF Transcript_42058/g.70175 Transcript_42058/m.70175 type:complete len:296 (-) Transcript_42058:680-1567(-)|eukprot:CAMPEP_0198199200 /NCGR_PEP_ID=MMETSP1445-20131203/2524_1 /TAXON_ID=36898 /ORGANISM="Pyramimonas sp., Strain CCMP2087" /LENGTH=295 /DNA_ID=CAMNT_0043868967 /DNA_START=114 /DNA_END=1001 /DNA_ORIENTATION=-